jgi:uncharacterized membrane protein
MTSFKATFRQTFIAGLLVSIPVMVTVFLLVWLFGFIDGFLSPIYDRAFGRHISGLGFLTTIALIFFIGIVATNMIGKKVIAAIEKPLLTIPIFKSFYAPLKSIVDAFSGSSSFKKFVIVEYPRPGIYAFGFLTKERTVKQCADGSCRDLMAIYVPTNNLYLGEIILMEPKDVFFTDIAVEDGIKIVLSGGIATPGMLRESKK